MEQRHRQPESGQGVASETFSSPLLETQRVKAEHNTRENVQWSSGTDSNVYVRSFIL